MRKTLIEESWKWEEEEEGENLSFHQINKAVSLSFSFLEGRENYALIYKLIEEREEKMSLV